MAEVLFPIERNGPVWKYVPMSYLLPHAEMTRAVTAGRDAAHSDNPSEAFKQSLKGIASDYLGPGVLGGVILGFLSNKRESGGEITRREGMNGLVDRIGYAAESLEPGFFRPAKELYAWGTGKDMDYNREPNPRDVGLKLMGLRVRTVNVEEDMRWTMMDFNRRWRAAASDQTIRTRKFGEGSPGAEDAAEYTQSKKEELWELYQSFRDDMRTLGISEKELSSAESERKVPLDLLKSTMPKFD
jgi:hypothetical protein